MSAASRRRPSIAVRPSLAIARLIVPAALLAALACLAPGCGPADALTKAEAEALLHAYTSAVAAGDSARAFEFWSPRARGREGFGTMHYCVGELMPFSKLAETVRRMTFEVREIVPGDGYEVIALDWIPRDGGADAPRQPMRFHAVRERGRLVLVNPIDALTADWQVHETERFRFHYPPDLHTWDHVYAMDRLTRDVGAIVRQLDIAVPDKMDYYFARTPEECGALMLQRPSNGYASLAHGLVVSVTFDNVHEAVHLLAHRAGMSPGNPALSEGLAVAFGGNTRTVADVAPQQASRFLADGRYVPVGELFADRDAFMRRNYITYFEAGAFVRFLFETYGAGRLVALARASDESRDVADLLRSTYDRALPELERGFKAWLEGRPRAEVETAVPDGAARLFSMTDPQGDDRGDGDYRYPNDRFAAGTFDLRGFEVLADADQVCFRVTLGTLDPPVSYAPDGERFAPGVVIAIDRRRGGRLAGDCGGVTFAAGEGHDLQVNAGIHLSLVNADGKVFWCGRNRLSRPGAEAGTLVFSLPVALIGRPEPGWRYFVGTGLVSDRTMDFLFAGPMPVVKESRVLIGGGDHDRGNPAFIDILLPPERDQAAILSDYDPGAGRRPVVPMVGVGVIENDRP